MTGSLVEMFEQAAKRAGLVARPVVDALRARDRYASRRRKASRSRAEGARAVTGARSTTREIEPARPKRKTRTSAKR